MFRVMRGFGASGPGREMAKAQEPWRRGSPIRALSRRAGRHAKKKGGAARPRPSCSCLRRLAEGEDVQHVGPAADPEGRLIVLLSARDHGKVLLAIDLEADDRSLHASAGE